MFKKRWEGGTMFTLALLIEFSCEASKKVGVYNLITCNSHTL